MPDGGGYQLSLFDNSGAKSLNSELGKTPGEISKIGSALGTVQQQGSKAFQSLIDLADKLSGKINKLAGSLSGGTWGQGAGGGGQAPWTTGPPSQTGVQPGAQWQKPTGEVLAPNGTTAQPGASGVGGFSYPSGNPLITGQFPAMGNQAAAPSGDWRARAGAAVGAVTGAAAGFANAPTGTAAAAAAGGGGGAGGGMATRAAQSMLPAAAGAVSGYLGGPGGMVATAMQGATIGQLLTGQNYLTAGARSQYVVPRGQLVQNAADYAQGNYYAAMMMGMFPGAAPGTLGAQNIGTVRQGANQLMTLLPGMSYQGAMATQAQMNSPQVLNAGIRFGLNLRPGGQYMTTEQQYAAIFNRMFQGKTNITKAQFDAVMQGGYGQYDLQQLGITPGSDAYFGFMQYANTKVNLSQQGKPMPDVGTTKGAKEAGLQTPYYSQLQAQSKKSQLESQAEPTIADAATSLNQAADKLLGVAQALAGPLGSGSALSRGGPLNALLGGGLTSFTGMGGSGSFLKSLPGIGSLFGGGAGGAGGGLTGFLSNLPIVGGLTGGIARLLHLQSGGLVPGQPGGGMMAGWGGIASLFAQSFHGLTTGGVGNAMAGGWSSIDQLVKNRSTADAAGILTLLGAKGVGATPGVGGYQTGGMVTGGTTDTVPAMLTPGEVVIPRHMVQQLGLNRASQTFQAGGTVPTMSQINQMPMGGLPGVSANPLGKTSLLGGLLSGLPQNFGNLFSTNPSVYPKTAQAAGSDTANAQAFLSKSLNTNQLGPSSTVAELLAMPLSSLPAGTSIGQLFGAAPGGSVLNAFMKATPGVSAGQAQTQQQQQQAPTQTSGKANANQPAAAAPATAAQTTTPGVSAAQGIAGLLGMMPGISAAQAQALTGQATQQAQPAAKAPTPYTWKYKTISTGPIDLWGLFAQSSGSGSTGSNTGSSTPTTSAQLPTGGSTAQNKALAQAMAAQRGWTGDQWTALDKLIMSESGYNQTATNPSSGAYGIAQALPATKYPAAGQKSGGSDPQTQIQWMLDYIAQRYGNPAAAWAFHQQHNYYARGTQQIDRTQLALLHRGEAVVPAADNYSTNPYNRGGAQTPTSGSTVHLNFKPGSVVLQVPANSSQQDMDKIASQFVQGLSKPSVISAVRST